MPSAPIRVLHVEDNRIQQALVARHLATVEEYQFTIHHVSGEEAAVETFRQGGYDLVILDYHLDQGDGLNCLRRIRRADAIVPIVAVSGVATSEIASQLIEAGADDYLGKKTLDSETLGQSVRNVLARAKAFRSRFSALEHCGGFAVYTPAARE
ncbi:MAG: response regulator [Pirellulales bacterium]|nr:response regulator [Pirellulales bacterium]